MTWDVVVVDDRSRFPLHVWRFLGRSLGFGVGEVGIDGTLLDREHREKAWIAAAPAKPLCTDDGRLRIWWVRADSHCESALEGVLRTCQGSIMVLVDVRGEPDSSYSYRNVYRYLTAMAKQLFPREVHIQVVSSYHPGRTGAEQNDAPEVLPKSRETLNEVAAKVLLPLPPLRATEVRHILITGAGFEILGERGGFGMPLTRAVLARMGSPFYSQGPVPTDFAVPLGVEGPGFPKPRGYERAYSSAVDEDLDAYWDQLLESVIDQAMSIDISRSSTKEELQLKAFERERAMREAFRRSLLLDDWGQLNQCLAAARLPWHAWLTTNYTQFSNRAIALLNDDVASAGGPWRIISTGTEAQKLDQEDAGGRGRQHSRFLFKLHGDIAHLETMAIAGQDKAIQTKFKVPIATLYEIYPKARRFLEVSLGEGARVVWHIVGHRFKDRGLREMVKDLQIRRTSWQIFAVADPQPERARDWLLQELAPGGPPPTVVTCPVTAASYLAHLERQGLRDENDAAKMTAWLQSLVSEV